MLKVPNARGMLLTEPTIRWQSDRLFFVGMAVAIAATVVVGFTWSFLRTDIARQLQSTWVKAHAVAFSAWILLYLCQSILVASRKIEVHRRLGIAGAVLASLMIALAAGSAISGFRASPARPLIEYVMLYVVVHVDIFMFATFVTLGLLLRGRPETHKRLMLLATIALLDAVTERLPGIAHISGYAHYVALDAFVLCGIVYDYISRGRVNPAYIWGGLIIVFFPPASRVLFATTVPHLVGAGAS
jgi:hypothetical protein